MPVDAFGRQAMTMGELIQTLTDHAALNPDFLDAPVWVEGERLFKPVRNVMVTSQRRTVLQVHHG